MSQINRLNSKGRVDCDSPINFTYNGRQMQGVAGDTLASALLANGVNLVGRSFKYSRPRGIVAMVLKSPMPLCRLVQVLPLCPT